MENMGTICVIREPEKCASHVMPDAHKHTHEYTRTLRERFLFFFGAAVVKLNWIDVENGGEETNQKYKDDFVCVCVCCEKDNNRFTSETSSNRTKDFSSTFHCVGSFIVDYCCCWKEEEKCVFSLRLLLATSRLRCVPELFSFKYCMKTVKSLYWHHSMNWMVAVWFSGSVFPRSLTVRRIHWMRT